MQKQIKNIKKVLLVSPPTGLFIREDRCQAPLAQIGLTTNRPPIELLYAAACMEKAGAECVFIDYSESGKDWEDFRIDLKRILPDLLVINVTTFTVDQDLKAWAIAKQIIPDILVSARGAHFLVYDIDMLKKYSALDIVMRKEGEMAFSELVEGTDWENIAGISYRRNDDFFRNDDREFIRDLDRMPFPARHLLDNDRYRRIDNDQKETTIQASRGCPFDCFFCIAGRLNGKNVRLRSPENIVDEIRHCIDEYAIRSFFLRGDTFTFDKNWVLAVCNEIVKNKLSIKWTCNSRVDTLDDEMLALMKSAGCYGITLGVESGSQMILDKISKKTNIKQIKSAVNMCNQAGILAVAYFIIGFPWEDKKTIRQTMGLSTDLSLDGANFYIAYPFPGSRFFDYCLENNLLEKDDDFNALPYIEAMVPANIFSCDELNMIRKKMFKRFYFRPNYLLRVFFRTKGTVRFYDFFKVGIKFFVNIFRK